MNTLISLTILALSIMALVLVITYSGQDNNDKTKEGMLDKITGMFGKKKEGYTMAPYGATVTPQGAITGPVVYTNHITKLQPNELLEQARSGKLNDQSLMILGAKNNSEQFDKALARQLEIHKIQDKSNNGFQTTEDLKEISKNIAQDANAVKGLFCRDGTASAKLFIDKYATVGVINEKYMPNRDRPKQLRAVGTVIVVPGFDFDATKALDSNGTGICPVGGVPKMNLERHRKKNPAIESLNNVNKVVVKSDDAADLLESNNILSATQVTDLNSADQSQALSAEQAHATATKPNQPTVAVNESELDNVPPIIEEPSEPVEPDYDTSKVIQGEPSSNSVVDTVAESFRKFF